MVDRTANLHSAWRRVDRQLALGMEPGGAPSCTRLEASAASLPTTPHSSQHLILNQSITKPQIHPDSLSNSNKPSTKLHPISVSICG